MKISKQFEKLGTLHCPLYGFISLSVNLLLAFYSLISWMEWRHYGLKGRPCSIFGWIFPDSFLMNPLFFKLAKILFIIFAILWILHLFIPITSWMTFLLYMLTASLFYENIWDADSHNKQIICVFLFFHALWYHFYGKKIVYSIKKRQVLSFALLPQWLHFLQISYIAMIYTSSGIQKLLHSGLGWVNGTSLQLWVKIFGNKDHFATQLILNNRDLAFFIQAIVLFLETTCFIGLFSRRFRIFSAGGLILFHIADEMLFAWDFYPNLFFVIIAYLPLFELLNRHFDKSLQRIN